MPDQEAQPIVIDNEGDQESVRQQAFREKVLADRGDALQHVTDIFCVACSFERK